MNALHEKVGSAGAADFFGLEHTFEANSISIWRLRPEVVRVYTSEKVEREIFTLQKKLFKTTFALHNGAGNRENRQKSLFFRQIHNLPCNIFSTRVEFRVGIIILFKKSI